MFKNELLIKYTEFVYGIYRNVHKMYTKRILSIYIFLIGNNDSKYINVKHELRYFIIINLGFAILLLLMIIQKEKLYNGYIQICFKEIISYFNIANVVLNLKN